MTHGFTLECCSLVMKEPCTRHSRLANDHEEWRKQFNRTHYVTCLEKQKGGILCLQTDNKSSLSCEHRSLC